MSYGKMNTPIEIVRKTWTMDEDDRGTETVETIAQVRAYREGRHGSERWANLAVWSEATDLYRFRAVPGVDITTDLRILCGDETFEITSVEDVKGRGMYLEVLAKKIQRSE